MRLKQAIGSAAILAISASAALAVEKPAQFWNLISSTVMSFELSKAGANAFGANLTTNDPDGSVDHDERLKLPGVASGEYDIRLKLKDGRTCFARGVKIAAGKVFSLEDKNLVDCTKA